MPAFALAELLLIVQLSVPGHIRGTAPGALRVKQLLHLFDSHGTLCSLQTPSKPCWSPTSPKQTHTSAGGEWALLEGRADVETVWLPSYLLFMEQLKDPYSCFFFSFLAEVCLLKNKQLKCQTSILQLGKRGGEAVIASHLVDIGNVGFLV